ncbi:hypothetical protein NMY22_g11772 [Coprinellus aureogranulatus]|nr:hypothetical protein NMY22_g11772 [Coprinellus aureogranulatus]
MTVSDTPASTSNGAVHSQNPEDAMFLNTVEGEIAFFRSLMRARPVGVHRYFHVLAIRNAIYKDTSRVVSVDAIWEKLRSCYNLEALEVADSEHENLYTPSRNALPIPIPSPSPSENLANHPFFRNEFQLPYDEDIETLISQRRMRATASAPSTPGRPSSPPNSMSPPPPPSSASKRKGEQPSTTPRGKKRERPGKSQSKLAGLVGGDSDSSALTQESGDEGGPEAETPRESVVTGTGTDAGTEYGEDDDTEMREPSPPFLNAEPRITLTDRLPLQHGPCPRSPRAGRGGKTPLGKALQAARRHSGSPVRLKEWIKGYPANLVFLQNPKAKPQPRKGSKTVRVVSVRRNVRMYTADLVKSASTWGQKTPGSQIHNSFALSKEWERIAPSTLKLPPRYSDAYKKKMNLPNSFHPEVAPGAYSPSTVSSVEAPSLSLSSTLSSVDSATSEYFGISKTERPAEKFRSLTDLKWGEFEDMGFDSGNTADKLRFDLTESARQERKSKRQTLDWNDFSTSGFSRMDAPLSATLQFSTPVLQTVSTWPAQQAEIHKKLKKQQKSLPAFGWDTEPVLGSEEVVEASFLDVFCDLIYGGGWMDLERGKVASIC